MRRLLFILFLFCAISCLYAQTGNQDSQLTSLLKAGRLEEARAIIRHRTDTEKTSDYYLFLHGMFSLDADSASLIYQRLMEEFPQSVYCDDALFRLAQLKYAQGLYKTSLTSFNKILSDHPLSPKTPQCYYWMGLCYQATDSPDSAKIYFEKVGTDTPSSPLSQIARDELQQLHDNNIIEQNSENRNLPLKFSVQVGAFLDQSTALINKSFYEKEGYRVHLRTKMKDNQQWYLVWLESFDSREEARKFGENLMKKYDISFFTVSEPSN
jgi:hypothetical protein